MPCLPFIAKPCLKTNTRACLHLYVGMFSIFASNNLGFAVKRREISLRNCHFVEEKVRLLFTCSIYKLR